MIDRYDSYHLHRFWLTLSTFAGIAPGASHWWCRIRWREDGRLQEANAEHLRDGELSQRFDTEAEAIAAGMKLVRKLVADRDYITYYIVIEGEPSCLDPRRCLSAPGNLRERLNVWWRRFEELNGWDGPKSGWPEVQEICDVWTALCGVRK